ncbi:PP2C family protein-serine/threonine phosphatase [Paracoccus tegillarcae]|uniref:Serine/threonine-protein phosphatase n=1 Tax=Paracoccus tegillarcae TaxID=1529068 RepID=A0A2K9EEZ5_9RHOB|nr:protein phosphatase 2C domain-containing protein [Paracoccus tegillarcae]AUH33523.1 serine/threonine-protein phosphatase [Paracoccus tegillarcae]
MPGDNDLFLFETGADSDTGRLREHNEDSYLTLPLAGVWVVADGMGGHQAGDVASAIITDEIESVGVPVSSQDQRARVSERLDRAHNRILAHSAEMGHVTIGATVVTLLIYEAGFVCMWAGDSRIYLMRNGRLSRLTIDHSEAQELLAAGAITEEEARNWPRKNVITRAIGIHDGPNYEAVTGSVRDGDVFLLCSDGLTEHMLDEELAAVLADTSMGSQQMVDRLVDETLNRGARDNVTAIVVRCLPRSDEVDKG